MRFVFKNQIYEFNCLPFGLNIAPRIFTKLLKPVAKYLRQKGCKIIIYLDDVLIIGDNFNECSQSVKWVGNLLEQLGFIINQEKSVLTPSQRLEYLGYVFDSHNMTLSLPKRKIIIIDKMLLKFKNLSNCKIGKFASLVGMLVSASATLKYAWLHVKPLEIAKLKALKLNKNNFNKRFQIPETINKEIAWWLNNINYTGKSLL